MFRILIVTSLIAGCGVLAWLWLASDLDDPTAAAAIHGELASSRDRSPPPEPVDAIADTPRSIEPDAGVPVASEPTRTATTAQSARTETIRVFDAQSQRPLRGAKLWLLAAGATLPSREPDAIDAIGVTAPDGSFALAAPSRSSVLCAATPDHFGAEPITVRADGTVDLSRVKRMRVALRGEVLAELPLLLAGRVVVADGSSPAGAIVTVSTAASWNPRTKRRKARSWTTTASHDGSFRIVADEVDVSLRVTVTLRELKLGPVAAQRGTADATFTLPAPGWIHGRLLCNDDVDPAALRVVITYEIESNGARPMHHVVSRAPTRDGRFGIEVPADRACTLIVGSERPGTAFVTIPDVGREPVERARNSSASDPRLAPIDLRNLAFAFSGRVESTHGDPIRNATIRTSNAITKSDPQGRFTVVLPPGPVKLLVSAAGYDGVQIPIATPGVVVRLEPTRSR